MSTKPVFFDIPVGIDLTCQPSRDVSIGEESFPWQPAEQFTINENERQMLIQLMITFGFIAVMTFAMQSKVQLKNSSPF